MVIAQGKYWNRPVFKNVYRLGWPGYCVIMVIPVTNDSSGKQNGLWQHIMLSLIWFLGLINFSLAEKPMDSKQEKPMDSPYSGHFDVEVIIIDFFSC